MRFFFYCLLLIGYYLSFNTGCSDESTPQICSSNDKIISTVDMEEGSLHYDQDINKFYIRYFIEGTIDSFWVGFICNEDFPDFKFEEGMSVLFSGNFRELADGVSYNPQIGGESFYELETFFLSEL